jgi:predicted amidohydrolase
MAFLGESFIASPLGEVVARAGSKEALIVAEATLESVKIAQKRLPYLQDCQGL